MLDFEKELYPCLTWSACIDTIAILQKWATTQHTAAQHSALRHVNFKTSSQNSENTWKSDNDCSKLAPGRDI